MAEDAYPAAFRFQLLRGNHSPRLSLEVAPTRHGQSQVAIRATSSVLQWLEASLCAATTRHPQANDVLEL
jgi:hypothetical protein